MPGDRLHDYARLWSARDRAQEALSLLRSATADVAAACGTTCIAHQIGREAALNAGALIADLGREITALGRGLSEPR